MNSCTNVQRERVPSLLETNQAEKGEDDNLSFRASRMLTALQYGHHVDNVVVSDGAQAHFGDNYTTINHYDQNTRLLDDTYEILLASLSFDRMGERVRDVSPALLNTSDWLPSHPYFAVWVDPIKRHEHNGFLWLKGKPGSGKSTIMKETLAWARNTWSDQIVLTHFFNARSPNTLEKSSLGLYRSLVSQLQNAVPISRDSFVEQFRPKIRYEIVRGENKKKVEEWKEAELQNFLVTFVQKGSIPPMTLFIDALDEGADNDVRAMVSFLEIWTDYATAAACPLRVCLSSRHYPYISVAKGLSLVIEDQTEHDYGIELYVNQKLAGGEQLGMSRIRQQVRDRSGGIFLWVVLVVQMLNRAFDQGKRTTAILQKLETIPTDLYHVFDQVFSQNLGDLDECITLLRWVLFAKRALTPVELYYAVQYSSSSEDDSADDDDNGNDNNVDIENEKEYSVVTPEEAMRYLLHCSRGLVELTHTRNPVVQFIHETVRSYLTDDRSLESRSATTPLYACQQNFEVDMCQQELSVICLMYMFHVFTHSNQINERSERFPFIMYAAKYWWQHYQCCPNPCSRRVYDLDLELLVGNRRRYLLLWVKLADFDFPTRVWELRDLAPVLYYAAMIGRSDLFLGVLALGNNISAEGGFRGSALAAAAAKGHTQIVQLLLDRGADVNSATGAYGYTVLTRASIYGHTQTVKLLLDRGADINAAGNGTRLLPLEAAASNGHTQIVQLLLERRADVNLEVERWALARASTNNHIQIVQLLLDARKKRYYEAALERASENGHMQIVCKSLDKAAVNCFQQTGFGGEALLEASERGHTQIVRILLDSGIRECNKAAAKAALRGYTQIVKMLLDAGASCDWNSALKTACTQGNSQLAHLMLERGANNLNKAMKTAAVRGHVHIVQILLDKGARNLESVLQAASARGHEQIVRMMRDRLVQRNTRNKDHDESIETQVGSNSRPYS